MAAEFTELKEKLDAPDAPDAPDTPDATIDSRDESFGVPLLYGALTLGKRKATVPSKESASEESASEESPYDYKLFAELHAQDIMNSIAKRGICGTPGILRSVDAIFPSADRSADGESSKHGFFSVNYFPANWAKNILNGKLMGTEFITHATRLPTERDMEVFIEKGQIDPKKWMKPKSTTVAKA